MSKCENCIDVNICNLSTKGSKFGCSFYKEGNATIVAGYTLNIIDESNEHKQAKNERLLNILKEKEVDLEYLCYTIRQQPFLKPSELLQLYNNRLIWGFDKRQLTLEEMTTIVKWLKVNNKTE